MADRYDLSKYGLKVGMLLLLEPDIETAISFYEKLGLKKQFHLKGQWAELLLGDIKIGLCPISQSYPDRHTGIVLYVNDLYQIYSDLKNMGVEFMGEPKSPEHGIMVSLKDPGNNIIDLYQPTPERVQEIVKSVINKSETCCSGKPDCKKTDC